MFKAKTAIMVSISNITPIMNYERSKSENKYQQLLTATMSHEMLTPLNSIIHLTDFVEGEIVKRVEEDL